MLHKAWNNTGEMPYCFPTSSIKFQGHTGQNNTNFEPNWAFLDYRLVAAFKSLRFALFLQNPKFGPRKTPTDNLCHVYFVVDVCLNQFSSSTIYDMQVLVAGLENEGRQLDAD